jgi:transposase
LEACTQSAVIARAAEAAGHQVRILAGSLVRTIGVGRRGIKTDERDALVLAEASHRIPELPNVHRRSRHSVERHQLQAARHLLVESRKRIVVSIKSFLRGRLQLLGGRPSKKFPEAARALALAHSEGVPAWFDALLATYEHLDEQIRGLTEQIERDVEQDATSQQLMTVTGIGPQVVTAFMAQLDDPHRFANADELGSYLCLVPGENTTGGHVKRTGTLRAGPKRLKALLVQAAWTMWRTRPTDPLVLWARAKADTRGKPKAIVALARKIAVILWAMWKKGGVYDPARAAAPLLLAPIASSPGCDGNWSDSSSRSREARRWTRCSPPEPAPCCPEFRS